MNTQDYIALENRYGATNYKPLDVVLRAARASGCGTSKATATWTASRPIRR